jgi:hypothetical protein
MTTSMLVLKISLALATKTVATNGKQGPLRGFLSNKMAGKQLLARQSGLR